MGYYSRYERRRQYRSRRSKPPVPWWRTWLWAVAAFVVAAVLLNVPGETGDQTQSVLKWFITAAPDLHLGEMIGNMGYEWLAALPVLGRVDDEDRWEHIRGSLLWPVTGEITSGFGWRQGVDGQMEFHEGVDFAVLGRETVTAAYDGAVTSIRTSPVYGLTVEIDHGSEVRTFYGRLGGVFVRENQVVAAGDKIGAVDGEVGPLHFEIRYKGVAVDPDSWFWDMRN